MVGALAKARGCRVVGIAGGKDKCDYVVNELGFDACIDYKEHKDYVSLSKALREACPDLRSAELWRRWNVREPYHVTAVYEYLTAEGRLFLLAARVQHRDPLVPKKFFAAAYFTASDTDPGGWERVHGHRVLGTGLPLFGLKDLLARPDAPVLVVEGEKAALLAAERYPHLVVVSWFGDSLDAGDCVVKPGVEYQTGAQTQPDTWNVGGFTRATAKLITQVSGAPQYGGTPDDDSVVRLLAELRHHLLSGHAVGKARVVLDFGGDRELPAGLQALEQERLQVRARGVDRRRVARRA